MNIFGKVMAIIGIVMVGIILLPVVTILAIPFGWAIGAGLVIVFIIWMIIKMAKGS